MRVRRGGDARDGGWSVALRIPTPQRANKSRVGGRATGRGCSTRNSVPSLGVVEEDGDEETLHLQLGVHSSTTGPGSRSVIDLASQL